MTEPNAAVRLFEGDGMLTDAFGTSASGEVVIEMRWFPLPQVMFEFTAGTASALDTGPAQLTIDRLPAGLIDGFITRLTRSMGGTGGFAELAVGVMRGTFGPSGSIQAIEFDVPNFPSFIGDSISDTKGRLSLGGMILEGPTSGLRLILDQADSYSTPDGVRNRLDRESGYALTHIGRIERTDKVAIGAGDAPDIVHAVSRFLSFVGGASTRALLARGLDASGAAVWERWDDRPVISPWRRDRAPFPDFVSSAGSVRTPDLDPIFDTFMARRDDPHWREILQLAVEWYVTANVHRSAETKLILAQAGLELAAWRELVPRMLTRKAFKDATAASSLALLLTAKKIPTAIPPSLVNLAAYGAMPSRWGGWTDGPTAITQIRNSLVHPTKALRPLDTPADVTIEAASLAVSYLELVLMHSFGYRDPYRSRTASWTTVPVPWA